MIGLSFYLGAFLASWVWNYLVARVNGDAGFAEAFFGGLAVALIWPAFMVAVFYSRLKNS